MKKILFVISLLLLLSPSVILAADQYYCKCEAAVLGGKRCQGGFKTTDAAKAACPECTQLTGDVTKDKDCVEETGTAPTAPAAGGTASAGEVVKLNNPLVGNVTDVNAIIGNIIKAATGVMGALVLLMIVWGGVTWLTAAGSPEKIKSGSNTIMWAILGAVVVLGSYLLLTAVLKGLAG